MAFAPFINGTFLSHPVVSVILRFCSCFFLLSYNFVHYFRVIKLIIRGFLSFLDNIFCSIFSVFRLS